MIATIVRTALIRLWHNKSELMLTFLVPILFFSIFAVIFGNRDQRGGTPKIKIAIADQANSPLSRRVLEILKEDGSLRFFHGNGETANDGPVESVPRNRCEAWVRQGTVTAAVVLLPAPSSANNSTGPLQATSLNAAGVTAQQVQDTRGVTAQPSAQQVQDTHGVTAQQVVVTSQPVGSERFATNTMEPLGPVSLNETTLQTSVASQNLKKPPIEGFSRLPGPSPEPASNPPPVRYSMSDTHQPPIGQTAFGGRMTDDSVSFAGGQVVSSGDSQMRASAVRDTAARSEDSAVQVASFNQPATSASGTQLAEHSGSSIRAELVADSYDQVATSVVTALLQKAMLTAVGEQAEANAVARQAGRPKIRALPISHANSSLAANAPGVPNDPASTGIQEDTLLNPKPIPEIELIDLMGGSKSNPVIAMYAAGIAVMFLLFSVTVSAGSLLEEQENGTLERLLASRLTMDQLLMGKWLYLVLLGSVQMTIMFAWGQMVFGVELIDHIGGFSVMTLVTCGAAASFALLLATLCKTRAQLSWVSIIVILSMSALGGSMVPRYLMSQSIQDLGLLTFNAWALDGFNKVFWRDLPLTSLQPQLIFLTLCGGGLLILARFFAIRWESQ